MLTMSVLVMPDDPDVKIKFLVAGMLNGAGSLVFDEYVTGKAWKNTLPLRLALNKAASDEIGWHCWRETQISKFYESGAAWSWCMPLERLSVDGGKEQELSFPVVGLPANRNAEC